MRLAGADQSAVTEGVDRLPGATNYLIGADSSAWHTDVPSYAQVRSAGVYPGIDLVYYGNQRQLEYDFVVAPGADPSLIQLAFEGADRMEVDEAGARRHGRASS